MQSRDLLKPSILKQLCVTHNFSPSKKYGQNYLITERPIQAMIDVAKLDATDTVLEIGPGFGILTLALAPLVKKVLAFEIEKKLQPYWEEQQKEYPNVEIVWGNALDKITNDTKKMASNQKYKILANLPYQITARAIRTILELFPAPEIVVLMVQKEVADRICAPLGKIKPKGKLETEVSLLTVAVQYYGTPRLITNVARGSFWPSPKVGSAIIAIEKIVPRPDAGDFFLVARAGFAHKRKVLAGNLAAGLKISVTRTRLAVKKIIGNEKARAEELSIAQWEALVSELHTE